MSRLKILFCSFVDRVGMGYLYLDGVLRSIRHRDGTHRLCRRLSRPIYDKYFISVLLGTSKWQYGMLNPYPVTSQKSLIAKRRSEENHMSFHGVGYSNASKTKRVRETRANRWWTSVSAAGDFLMHDPAITIEKPTIENKCSPFSLNPVLSYSCCIFL